MTPEKQRIAIAHVCGYRKIHEVFSDWELKTVKLQDGKVGSVATAAQRAEAFIRVLKKWEKDEDAY